MRGTREGGVPWPLLYLYRLATNESIQARKLTLLR